MSPEQPLAVGPSADLVDNLVDNLVDKDLLECGFPMTSGAPCRSTILTVASGRTRCWMHSASRDEVLAATRRGGRVAARALSRPDAPNPALKTVADVQAFLQELAGEVLRGVLSSKDANALTRIAETAVRAHDANVGQRLDELEDLAAKRARALPVSARVRVLR